MPGNHVTWNEIPGFERYIMFILDESEGDTKIFELKNNFKIFWNH
jgi:hypothetical protein